MVNYRDLGILECITNHCDRIEKITNGLTKEEYLNNEDYREIICFHILQIGELVKHLSADFVKENKTIPWKKIAGMRDKVAHGYGTIDIEEVWKVAHNDVPVLNEYCKQILTSQEN